MTIFQLLHKSCAKQKSAYCLSLIIVFDKGKICKLVQNCRLLQHNSMLKPLETMSNAI